MRGMKKVTVLGAGGMAGHMVSLYLISTGRYTIQNLSHGIKLASDWLAVDVEDINALESALDRFAPDLVINCVGKLVKESESNSELAYYVNGSFPHLLERQAGLSGFRVIHLSTDCVFSGQKGGYTESAARDGKGPYAQSKAMGELLNDRDLTIRTSIVGPELKENATGLFHWLMTSEGPVQGFQRVFWNGVTTLELAKAIDAFIGDGTVGLYHLASPGRISKHDLITLMRDIWMRKLPRIIPESDTASDKTLISTRTDLPFLPVSYSRQLHELRAWVYAHKELYPLYL